MEHTSERTRSRGLGDWLRGGSARVLLTGAAVGLGIGTLGSVAYAAIPGTGGIILGCVTTTSEYRGQHALTLLDTAQATACQAGQTLITWNQTGPQGPQGPKGDTGAAGAAGGAGPQGPAGTSVTVGPISSGPGCGTPGGVRLTDGIGDNYNICNGAKGPKGDTGPQGPKGDTGAAGAAGATGPQGPSGVSGYQIVVQDDTIGYASSSGYTLFCPSGKLAISGGVQDLSHANGIYVNESYPSAGRGGWRTNSTNNGFYGVIGDSESLRYYVICATMS